MIKSPTYTIVREYEGRLPLYHLDVYRIEGDADSIDLDEFLFGSGVTVIGGRTPIRRGSPIRLSGIRNLKTVRGRDVFSCPLVNERQKLGRGHE